MKTMIYLDNAATTYPKPEVVYEALNYANRNLAFNAGRGHYPASQKVFEMIKETKQLLGELLSVSSETVSFESSATESLNIIIQGLDLKEGDNVYISPFEHNAIVRPLSLLKKTKGIKIHLIPFDKQTWEPELNKLNDMFAMNSPKAILLSHISNVTGYILPFESIFALAKKYRAITVLDCAQSLGVLNPSTNNVDFIVFAGHKSLYASFGIAGFYNLTGYKLSVVKSGGTGSDSLNPYMPETGSERYESGSLNSVAVAGLNASLKWLKDNPPYEHERELTEYLIEKISKISGVRLFSPITSGKILGIISFSCLNYLAEDVGSILSEEYNISVRTGFHCSPNIHSFIGSLYTLGTVRVSLGAFTTKEDIDNLILALRSL